MIRSRIMVLPVTMALWVMSTMISCSGRVSTETRKDIVQGAAAISQPEPAADLINMLSPTDNSSFSKGMVIDVSLSPDSNITPDSIRIYFDGKLFDVLGRGTLETSIATESSRLGQIAVKAVAYSGDLKPHVVTHFISLFSDHVPKVQHYSVIATYPHDSRAYTQGLVYHDGYFFESTGQEGSSSLRKVEINNGQVTKIHNLEPSLFGEGIVLLKDRIYQLTWTSRVGFVYDAATFDLIKRVHYNTEGWGLTTDGDRLILSDGTNKLYFIDPEYFTVSSTLEVYDNQRAVDQLNELEYINGEIWANIYQTDMIARIDPATGEVIAYIDFSGLLTPEEKGKADVLNGIAWDPDTGRIWVTGKWWPKLFLVKITG